MKLCQIEEATKQHKKALSKASTEETIETFDKVGRISILKSISKTSLYLQTYAENRMTIPSSSAAQSARYKAFGTHISFVAEALHNNRKSPSR